MPTEVFETFSVRQIAGFFEIYADKKMEEVRFEAALHGAKLDSGSGRRRNGGPSGPGVMKASEVFGL